MPAGGTGARRGGVLRHAGLLRTGQRRGFAVRRAAAGRRSWRGRTSTDSSTGRRVTGCRTGRTTRRVMRGRSAGWSCRPRSARGAAGELAAFRLARVRARAQMVAKWSEGLPSTNPTAGRRRAEIVDPKRLLPLRGGPASAELERGLLDSLTTRVATPPGLGRARLHWKVDFYGIRKNTRGGITFPDLLTLSRRAARFGLSSLLRVAGYDTTRHRCVGAEHSRRTLASEWVLGA